jgi:7-cyano-7-deazaguanine synthase in queuosine biosynthesis
MTARVVVLHGLAAEPRESLEPTADVKLAWDLPSRNVQYDLDPLAAAAGRLGPAVRDLVDLAAAVYLADLAVPRGRNEQYVRSIEVHLPLRRPERFEALARQIHGLLYRLCGDNMILRFYAHEGESPTLPSGDLYAVSPVGDADCVCLLSGGLDSLAGAVMLLRTGRHPLFISHRSGNPTVSRAQGRVLESLQRLGYGFGHAPVYLSPRAAPEALPFPPPEAREPSRRSRSLLFMALGAAAAVAAGVSEVYLCENGILTAALPLTPGRAGALSTRSTHPAVLSAFSDICGRLGLSVAVLNPFLYSTKTEILRDVLRPVMRPEDILATVSCWMAGRRHRQCGGCIPCLLRRLSLLAACLPDEAYEEDCLSAPEDYRGTDAYTNLVDLLSYVASLRARSEVQILLESPSLLDLQPYGVSLPDVVLMLRRFAAEVTDVVGRRFPASARLLAQISSREGL